MDKQTLGMLIKEKRKEKKITQKQLALQLNVTETAVSKWERGINYPDIEILTPLSAALGIPVSSLFGNQFIMDEGAATPDTPPAEDCNAVHETEAAPTDKIPGTEDSDNDSQDPEPTLSSWFFQRKATLLKTAILLFCILILGKIVFVPHAQANTSEKPSFTITDEYYDDYNGRKVYHLIVEYTGEPTNECLLKQDDTLRDTYSKYLEECGMLLAFYFKSGTDYEGIDLEDSADYCSISYPYPSQ